MEKRAISLGINQIWKARGCSNLNETKIGGTGTLKAYLNAGEIRLQTGGRGKTCETMTCEVVRRCM